MAATYHTTHLGLSLWAQTDCPQWVDFLQDNQKLDQQVGGHIQDSALHLTAEEKQYLSQRSASVTYTGTGSGTQSVTLPFLPRKLTVLAQGKPPWFPVLTGAGTCTWKRGSRGRGSGIWHGRHHGGCGHFGCSVRGRSLLRGVQRLPCLEPKRRHLCSGAGSLKDLTAGHFCTIIGLRKTTGGRNHV